MRGLGPHTHLDYPRQCGGSLVVTHYVRKLPDMLSIEETVLLLGPAPGITHKAALGVAYGAGPVLVRGRPPQDRRYRQHAHGDLNPAYGA